MNRGRKHGDAAHFATTHPLGFAAQSAVWTEGAAVAPEAKMAQLHRHHCFARSS